MDQMAVTIYDDQGEQKASILIILPKELTSAEAIALLEAYAKSVVLPLDQAPPFGGAWSSNGKAHVYFDERCRYCELAIPHTMKVHREQTAGGRPAGDCING